MLFSVTPVWSGARTAAADDDIAWILGQINGLRAAHGIKPLALNAQLLTSATGHSQYLANNPWHDAHVEADGSTPRSRILATGYPASATGENVYGGGLATAAIAFNWWVASPVHLEGMVNAGFSEVGIGIASGPYGHFFTTDFGDRNGASNPLPPGSTQVAAAHSTRRPATAFPTATPTLSLTPSQTFTPIPTSTPTATNTAIPPTGTPIQIDVQPQGSVPTATRLPKVAIVVTAPPVTVAPIVSPPALATAVPNTTGDAQPAGDNPLRALIPLAIGLQIIILGGLALRGRRH